MKKYKHTENLKSEAGDRIGMSVTNCKITF